MGTRIAIIVELEAVKKDIFQDVILSLQDVINEDLDQWGYSHTSAVATIAEEGGEPSGKTV